MPRVYQRVAFAFPLAASLALTACSRGAESPESRAAARPAVRSAASAVSTEKILAARTFELVALADSPPRLLADELSSDGARAVALPFDGGETGSPAAPEATESRVVAALPGGQLLLEEIAGGAARLVLVGPGSRRAALAPLASGRERLLAVSFDRRTVWTVAREAGDGAERLVETKLPGGGRRALEEIAAPFTAAAISPDGHLLALRRTIHGEADEVVLSDRRSGEMRLLLPDRDEGRFRPLEFWGTDRFLLLLADDGGDRTRLETVELATGDRRRILDPSPECEVTDARRTRGAELRADLLCRGRRTTARFELSGRPRPLPALPPGLRATAFLARPNSDSLAFGVAGVATTDLWTWGAADGLRPLTYGAPPALDPDSLGPAEPLALGATGLPAELWTGPGPMRAGLVWIDDGASQPNWAQLAPTTVALVARGVSVLRVRLRGAEGFGRSFRRAADGDPGAAALADIETAAISLASRLPGGSRIAVVAQGSWEGAALLAALSGAGGAATTDRFAAAVALFPSPDPFALFDRVAATAEPARSWLIGRWGDPASPTAGARRAAWRFPLGAARRPTLVLLDDSLAESAPLVDQAAAARAAGRPVEAVLVGRPVLGPLVPRAAALRLLEFLERHLFSATDPPSEPR